jgi:ferredoxin
MSDDVYSKLAERLDEIPNGFTRTESGIELRLLAKMYEPLEAETASAMRLTPEPPAAIGERVGLDAEAAAERLAAMRKRGLIRASRGDAGPLYGLMPFAVGVYEDQLGRMDEEMASLFEQYYQESRGGIMTQGEPALHRVIPVEQSVPVDIEVFPYERATEMLERARAWGVRDCICRVQQKKIGKGCDSPIDNCIVFAPVPGVFDKSEEIRVLSKEEALGILAEAADAGLVHSTSNQQDQIHYICNCCTCCCGILRGVAEFAIPTAVARSDFQMTVDDGACVACGACLDRCRFGAMSVDDVCAVDETRCVGCGVCVTACPADALVLRRRPEGQVDAPPANGRAWMAERAKNRGKSMEGIL